MKYKNKLWKTLKKFNHWNMTIGFGLGILFSIVISLLINVPTVELWKLVTLNIRSLILLLFALHFLKKASQAYTAKGKWLPKERPLTVAEVLGSNWMTMALTGAAGLCLYAVDPVLFDRLIGAIK